MKTFTDKLIDRIKEKNSILCVGLDPQVRYLPQQFSEMNIEDAFFEFNREIIDAVKEFVPAVKPQMAFYERYGSAGIRAFEKTVEYAKKKGLIVIEDAKRGDGSDTAIAYAEGHIGKNAFLEIDAVTIQPGLGLTCLDPFINVVKETGNGIFVVTKSSFNPSSFVENLQVEGKGKVWEEISKVVNELGQEVKGEYGYSNVGVVMGSTYPEDADRMRKLIPKAFFLVPGYGAQGGGADEAVRGIDEKGLGVIINSSRGIIYAYRKGDYKCTDQDFAQAAGQAAKFARDDLNFSLQRKLESK